MVFGGNAHAASESVVGPYGVGAVFDCRHFKCEQAVGACAQSGVEREQRCVSRTYVVATAAEYCAVLGFDYAFKVGS